jgi:hypothetical protein
MSSWENPKFTGNNWRVGARPEFCVRLKKVLLFFKELKQANFKVFLFFSSFIIHNSSLFFVDPQRGDAVSFSVVHDYLPR